MGFIEKLLSGGWKRPQSETPSFARFEESHFRHLEYDTDEVADAQPKVSTPRRPSDEEILQHVKNCVSLPVISTTLLATSPYKIPLGTDEVVHFEVHPVTLTGAKQPAKGSLVVTNRRLLVCSEEDDTPPFNVPLSAIATFRVVKNTKSPSDTIRFETLEVWVWLYGETHEFRVGFKVPLGETVGVCLSRLGCNDDYEDFSFAHSGLQQLREYRNSAELPVCTDFERSPYKIELEEGEIVHFWATARLFDSEAGLAILKTEVTSTGTLVITNRRLFLSPKEGHMPFSVPLSKIAASC